MSNNIIAHLIFFLLHTFLILHIPRFPTTTHFEITSTRFGTTNNNSTHLTFCFLLFISFFNTLSLSLSLSLSLVNLCRQCGARGKCNKKKVSTKAGRSLQICLSLGFFGSLLSQHNIINLIFFFIFF